MDRAGSSGRGAVVDDNILLDSPCTGETSTGEVHGQRHTHDMACMHACSTLSVIVVVVVVVVVFVIGARTTPGWTSRLTIQPVQASCHYPTLADSTYLLLSLAQQVISHPRPSS